jgi:hypothetical protein
VAAADHLNGQFDALPKPGVREALSRVWHDTTSMVSEERLMSFQQRRSAEFNDRNMSYAQQATDRSLPYHVRVDQAEKARGNRQPWS